MDGRRAPAIMAAPMEPPDLDRLGRLLMAEGLVSHEDMESALKDVRDPAARRALEQTSYVRHEELAAFLAMDYRVPELEIIPDELIDEASLRLLPESYVRRAHVMPLKRVGAVTLVAATDLPDVVTLNDIRSRVKSKVKVIRVPEAEMERQFQRLRPVPKVPTPAAGAAARKPTSTAELAAVKVDGAPPPAPAPPEEAPAAAHALGAVRLSDDEFARLARQYGEPVVRQWERRYASSEPIPATRVQ